MGEVLTVREVLEDNNNPYPRPGSQGETLAQDASSFSHSTHELHFVHEVWCSQATHLGSNERVLNEKSGVAIS